MAELMEKLKFLSTLEAHLAQLQTQQEQEKTIYEQSMEELKKERDAVASEWEQKMSKAVEKQKKLGDDELTKTRAELLLQVGHLHLVNRVALSDRRTKVNRCCNRTPNGRCGVGEGATGAGADCIVQRSGRSRAAKDEGEDGRREAG